MWVSERNRTRTSHPPENRRQPCVRERRPWSEPQRHGRTCSNETFELGAQNSQAIEARESEYLAPGGEGTGVPRWDRWRSIGFDVVMQNDVAVFHDDEARIRGAGLGPHHARIDQPRQPDGPAAGERPTQRAPLQRSLDELCCPGRDGASLFIFVDVVVSPPFSPESCAEPQQSLVRGRSAGLQACQIGL